MTVGSYFQKQALSQPDTAQSSTVETRQIIKSLLDESKNSSRDGILRLNCISPARKALSVNPSMHLDTRQADKQINIFKSELKEKRI